MAALPTEDELHRYATQKREQQQELDDLNVKIADLNGELAAMAEASDVAEDDDDEEQSDKTSEADDPNAKKVAMVLTPSYLAVRFFLHSFNDKCDALN